MKPEDLKKALMRLWKDTFNDSDEYVRLIFSSSFSPSLAEVEVVDDEVVAGLVGVPYQFGNAEKSLRGLYLCGLSTSPKFRSRGIMSALLERINTRAAELGFAFSFLIPADSGLRKYYHDRGYVNAFYRVVDNYTSLHDFSREYESVLLDQKEKVVDLKRKYFASLAGKILDFSDKDASNTVDSLVNFIRKIEDSQQDFCILHSDSQLKTIFEENKISKGEIVYVENSNGEPTAVAFCEIEHTAPIKVVKLFAADLASKYRALHTIKSSHPDFGICHFVPSVEMDRKAVWARSYGSFLGEAPQAPSISNTERVYSLAAHAKVYGMARILNLHEILKFQAEGRHDLKYSILTKSTNPDILDQIEVRNGRLNVKEIPFSSLSPSQTAHLMSKRDISEILFRRRDTDNLITEAFGIPSINASIALMLD